MTAQKGRKENPAEHPRSVFMDELIDDREVSASSDDRLGHKQLAYNLADLAMSVQTPTNIALYGPWGSGKSGIANLLRERLDESNHHKAGLVVYDAFKYRHHPMRREFILEVARQTDYRDVNRLKARLYTTSTGQDINLPKLKELYKPFVWFVILVSGFALLAALVAGALIFTGTSTESFVSIFGRILASGLVPSALLAGFIGVAGRTVTVIRTSPAPASEEEFETEFRKLVQEANGNRLIVFVDELDRCAPNTVVDTLDTIRTFLGVEGTVFIVAADRNVLEDALTESVSQTTPADLANPYYSSGNAYLDKVFNYQFTIPPLLPNRITQYTIDLLHGKPGLWETIDARAVAPVLIPTHVRSPRRVKMLINNFVLTYRTLEARADGERGSVTITDREREIAKLVCLQTEFPLFARDLANANNLAALVLRYLGSEIPDTRPEDVRDRAWEIAKKYATSETAAGHMLDPASGAHADTANSQLPTNDVPTTPGLALNRLLLDYLRKTRNVDGPSRDLVFHESSGSTFGLDDAFALEIEDAVVNGLTDEIRRVTSDTSDSEGSVEDLLQFLISLVDQSLPGVEGENAASALLAAAAEADDEALDPVADRAIRALVAHRDRSELQDEDLAGAWSLGLRSKLPVSDELTNTVLRHPNAVEDPDLGLRILSDLGQLTEEADNEASPAIIAARIKDPQTAAQAAALVAPYPTLTVLAFDNLVTEFDEDGVDDEEVEGISIALAASTDVEGDLIERLLVVPIRLVDDPRWLGVANATMPSLNIIRHDSLIESIVSAIKHLDLEMTAEWLERIEISPSTHAPRESVVGILIDSMWDRRGELGADYDSHDPTFIHVLELVQRFADDCDSVGDDLTGRALADTPKYGPSQAANAETAWGYVRRFAETGLVNPATATTAIMARASTTLTGAAAHDVERVVTTWMPWFAENTQPPESVDAYVQVIAGSTVLSPRKEELAIVCARDLGVAVSPYMPEKILGLIEAYGGAADGAVAVWLSSYANSADTIWPAISPALVDGRYSEDLSRGMATAAKRLPDNQLLELFRRELHSLSERDPSIVFLGDIRAAEIPDRTVVEELIVVFEAHGTNHEKRKRIFAVWESVLPIGTRGQQKLIDNVFLPSLRKNKSGGVELARAYPRIWNRPTGRFKDVREALFESAGGRGKHRQLEHMMRENGLIRSSWLGRSKDVEEN